MDERNDRERVAQADRRAADEEMTRRRDEELEQRRETTERGREAGPAQGRKEGGRPPRLDWTSEDAAGPGTGDFPVYEQDVCPEENPKPGDVEDEMVSEDRNPPGTQDDVPYSRDEDRPEQKPPLEPRASGNEESDLWRQMEQLNDEDGASGYRVPGLPEDEVDEVREAIGDDASEEAQGDNAGPASADKIEPDHGGFPERK